MMKYIALSLLLLGIPLIKSQSNNDLEFTSILERNQQNLRDDNQYALMEFFGGFFEENGLQDPVFFAPCFDEDAAKDANKLIGDFLTVFSSIRIRRMIAFKKEAQDFNFISGNNNALHCLYDAPELRVLLDYYHLTTRPDWSKLLKRLERYLSIHAIHAHKELRKSRREWEKNEFRKCGKRLAQLMHKIF